MASLKSKPRLGDFQKYVAKSEKERGFEKDTVLQKCLLLGEEVGELFKSVRKSQGLKLDKHAKLVSVEDELTDVFIYLCAIANRTGIDLEKAFRSKEEKNKRRVWE
jgi:NTP pyrophosphatase (non-canonical NTP hydrolase)